MAWTTPLTWTPTLINAANLNEQIRDNLNYLKNRPVDIQDINNAANFTTTSTSFVDTESASAEKLDSDLITTTGGTLVIRFNGAVALSTTMRVYFQILIYASNHLSVVDRVGTDDGFLVVAGASSDVIPVSFAAMVDGLAAGDYYVQIQWKVSTGTATLYGGAGTANFDVHPQLSAYEEQ